MEHSVGYGCEERARGDQLSMSAGVTAMHIGSRGSKFTTSIYSQE